MVKSFFSGSALVAFALLLISCGSSSSEAGSISDSFFMDDDSYENGGKSSSSRFAHSRTGFFISKNHKWGFEDNTARSDRETAYISFEEANEGFAQWYVLWADAEEDVDESYSFFICNPQKENIGNSNIDLTDIGLNDGCYIDSLDILRQEKICGEINVKDYYALGYDKIGLCSQHDSDPPTLKATLSLVPYRKENYDIIFLSLGDEPPYKRDSISAGANLVFRQGVAQITLQQPRVNYSRTEVEPTYGYSDPSMSRREEYLFVGAGEKLSLCYQDIPDDIDILEKFVNKVYFYDNSMGNPGRVAIMINKSIVSYWTFNSDFSVCEDKLLYPIKRDGTEYSIGAINSKEEEWRCRFDDYGTKKSVSIMEAGKYFLIMNGQMICLLSIQNVIL